MKWMRATYPAVIQPDALKACGNVIQSAPALPLLSIPFERKEPWKFHSRVWSGTRPVIKELRVGEQMACCTYLFVVYCIIHIVRIRMKSFRCITSQ